MGLGAEGLTRVRLKICYSLVPEFVPCVGSALRGSKRGTVDAKPTRRSRTCAARETRPGEEEVLRGTWAGAPFTARHANKLTGDDWLMSKNVRNLADPSQGSHGTLADII